MKVLLATDGSANAEEAAWFLSRLSHNDRLELTVLFVLYRPDFYETSGAAGWLQLNNEAAKKRFAEVYTQIQTMFEGANATLSLAIVEGHVAQTIVAEAQSRESELVVMGARGQSAIGRLLLGSNSEFVATHAPCSVLVVRSTGLRGMHKRDLRICIAYDGSEQSQAAIEQFCKFEWREHTRIDVITAVSTVGSFDVPIPFDFSESFQAVKRANEEAAAKVRLKSSHVNSFVREAYHVGDSLVRFLEERRSDLVVVGDTGQGMLGRIFLGSVSRFVLGHAGCSVWIVRKPHSGR
jgi:nucleotide-binding universal stress UspA family protein